MAETVITLILLAATALLIGIIRLLTVKKSPCAKPSGELRIFYDENCECLEYTLSRISRSKIFDFLDLEIIITDETDDCESAAFLEALRRKTGIDFITESGGNRR